MKINKPLIIVKCGKCGEYLELVKVEKEKLENGKVKQSTYNKMVCLKCDKSY